MTLVPMRILLALLSARVVKKKLLVCLRTSSWREHSLRLIEACSCGFGLVQFYEDLGEGGDGYRRADCEEEKLHIEKL